MSPAPTMVNLSEPSFNASSSALRIVWESIGAELVIFSVTVCFAIVVRVLSPPITDRCSKKGLNIAAENSAVLDTKRQTITRSPSHGAAGGGYSSIGNSNRGQVQQSVRNGPCQIVDKIMSLMRDHPGQQSAGQALQLYKEFQHMIGLCGEEAAHADDSWKDAPTPGMQLVSAMRRSKSNAVELYTTLVQCATRSGQCQCVDRLMDDMVRLNVPRTLAFYESAMKQIAGQKYYQLALSIYDRLHADGLEPSAVTCSCLISFAAEVGEYDRAIAFFEKLSALTTPSIRAFMTVLRVRAKQQDWDASVAILRSMQKRGLHVDSLALNVVLATGVSVDKLGEAEELIADAEAANHPFSDVVSYNTLIKGYAQRSDSASAWKLVAKMQKRGLKQNPITYNTLMDMLVRGQKIREAWELLREMRGNGFKPDKFTCSILVKGLAKAPQPEIIYAALELLQEVPDSGCDITLRSTLFHIIVDAAAQLPDNLILMKAVTCMRQHRIALSDSAQKQFHERMASAMR